MHTQKVLESIKKNNIKNLIIFVDGLKHPQDKKKRNQLIKIIKQYKSLIEKIIYRKENLGLAKNIENSINETFENGAEGIVVLEDDCVLKKNASVYFKKCLEKYYFNKEIRSVCGYNLLQAKFQKNYKDNLLMIKRFSTWGWATWKDRWKDFIDRKKILKKNLHKINHVPKDLQNLIKITNTKNFKKNIWSIDWIFIHYATKTFCIYPPCSMIENIGLDGSGVNCKISNMFSENNTFNLTLKNINFNEMIYDPISESQLDNFMEKNYSYIYPGL